VVNRLEVALRLAWLNCNGGSRRGVKLKEKASVAGVVANVYWRKNGCVDWWANLDATTRRKVLTVALGKSAKALYFLRNFVYLFSVFQYCTMGHCGCIGIRMHLLTTKYRGIGCFGNW